ncbi:hypothetical protein WICANDRAFT_76486 [Wickerhamomyces anomalus NRRL Y-366-8]|uniref:HIT-type domain-containing protein n=1 Tax=Wickerhamomyces anomalus (strain ATCC 58044 / CBS 1984 / NCYC 433 / NRRL Y-366-8) TaxID=683960 RepID=A0A1E3PA91_WICAA|nr:uncharacterized protein WICANDRAFT_76486 [Wickerhamomyces anomalus NRRL Y-366-8]ODQ62311.1 hypothetical protein WICANDRAFT_76486 [Wickerhamomyces anomalus NRRL Y-366-8]
MTLVEEITNKYDRDSYFTSSINLPSKSKHKSTSQDNRPRKRLAPGTYNLATIESNLHGTGLTEDLAEQKNSMKRFDELDKENYNESSRIELPKTGLLFEYNRFESNSTVLQNEKKLGPKGGRLKQGNTAQVKKILASRKQLSNYLDEDDKNASILFNVVSKKKNLQFIVPNKKLCSICGDNAPGSCVRCNSRVCSVKCSTVHNETRCSNYYG